MRAGGLKPLCDLAFNGERLEMQRAAGLALYNLSCAASNQVTGGMQCSTVRRDWPGSRAVLALVCENDFRAGLTSRIYPGYLQFDAICACCRGAVLDGNVMQSWCDDNGVARDETPRIYQAYTSSCM